MALLFLNTFHPPEAVEGSIEDAGDNDVTGGREGWKKLGVPAG